MHLDPDQRLYEEVDTRIEYSPGWTRAFGGIYHGSAVQRTWGVGEWVSFKFNGSGIAFLGAQGWDHGQFRVELDPGHGPEREKVYIRDGACCISYSGGYPQVVQLEIEGLDRSEHEIRITNYARGPRGAVLEVDAFIVRSHPASFLGIEMTPPTYTLIALFSIIAYLCLLLVYLGRRRNDKWLKYYRSLGSVPDAHDEEEEEGEDGDIRLSLDDGGVGLRGMHSSRRQRQRREADAFFVPLLDPPPAYTTAGATLSPTSSCVDESCLSDVADDGHRDADEPVTPVSADSQAL